MYDTYTYNIFFISYECFINIVSYNIIMSLCKFNEYFGKPKSGVHRYRIFNIAIIDVLFTVIGAYVMSYYLKLNFIITLSSLFLLGIILHRLFCVRTTVDLFITYMYDNFDISYPYP